MSAFAENTTVPVERTKQELIKLLQKHGASQRGIADDDEHGLAIVAFRMNEMQINLQVPLPKKDSFPDPQKSDHNQKLKCPRGWSYWTVAKRTEWVQGEMEQASRARWRAVMLITKAKLEYIALGQSTVDREFLPDIRLPNGRSVGEWLSTGLKDALANGHMPPLLGMGSREEEA